MRLKPFRTFSAGLSVLFVAWTMTACIGGKVFDKYRQLPVEGWEKHDTLSFSIPAVVATGEYELGLGLRATGIYPYMSLALVIETDVISTDSLQPSFRSSDKRSYSKSFQLVNQRGYAEGQGVSLFQYHFPLATLSLQAGDSLNVNIRHNMRQEMLRGISDLGISLVHTGN